MEGKICFECGEPAKCDHHVIPKSKGGKKTVPLCDKCHSVVHDSKLVTLRHLAQAAKKKKRKLQIQIERERHEKSIQQRTATKATNGLVSKRAQSKARALYPFPTFEEMQQGMTALYKDNKSVQGLDQLDKNMYADISFEDMQNGMSGLYEE